MGNVHSDSQELLNFHNSIKSTLTTIATTKTRLRTKYEHLGGSWKDSKYRELGNVVQECNSALNSIERTLSETQKYLFRLIRYLQEYEQINLGSGTESSVHRHISAREESHRWEESIRFVNNQIEQYREALMSRGVPDCSWLTSVLARHRSAMLEQEGYTLDVASNNASTSIHNPNAYNYPADYSSFFDSLSNDFRNYCLSRTNPNYNSAPEWNNNCQRCVPTLEMNRRGNDVTVRPSTYGSEHLSYHPYDVWENANVITTTGSGIDDIRSTMSEWGDGARAQIVVYWNSPHGGGHTFFAEQINGNTVFSDPQTGNTNVENYFNRVSSNSTTFCRIDNLEFSNYINDCYSEV